MPDTFDVKFKLLPPDLQARLWVLGLDANTSKVGIAYKTLDFKTGVAYKYGGNAEAFLSYRNVNTTLGVNPSNGNLDLSVVYRGFNFGTTANIAQKSYGLSLTYGSDLIPFPEELTDTFNRANGGLDSMARDIQAAPNNPLAWYKIHSDDIGTITKAAQAIQNIAKLDNKSNNFGAGLRVNYSQQTGVTIYGGVQWKF
jgi:hypothetical protein